MEYESYFTSTSFTENFTEGATLRDISCSPEVTSQCALFRFLFNTCLIGTLCILGLVGNVLSIVLLQKDSHNRVAVFLLQALAVADNSVIIVTMIVLSLLYGVIMQLGNIQMQSAMVAYIFKYVHPVGYVSHSCAVWMAVLLAVNRYVAICKPFHAHHLTLTRAKIQVFIVVSVFICFNSLRFFQHDIVQKTIYTEIDSEGNQINETITTYAKSWLGEQAAFQLIYTNFLYTILVLLLPLILLVVLNVQLIVEYRRAQFRLLSNSLKTPPARSRSNSNGSLIENRNGVTHHKGAKDEEDNITGAMIAVVLILVICHTPDRVLQVIKELRGIQVTCPQPLYFFESLSNFLIVFNSSTNFIVYFVCRRRFRQTFKQWWGRKVGHNGVSSTGSRFSSSPLQTGISVSSPTKFSSKILSRSRTDSARSTAISRGSVV